MSGKVSIIVPVYNAEKTLERCVASLTGQTYSDLEILLVNDGSPDRSLDLCRGLARQDARIRVIDKPNGGVSSARNAGLDAATGEYIMFCDSDDWVDPAWCAQMLAHYDPQDLVVCQIARQDVPEDLGLRQPVVVAERREFLHYPMLMCSPVNKLYSRQIIEASRVRFSEELSLGEDFCFVLEYLCHITGQVTFLQPKLYCYDTSAADSLSKRAPAIRQCQLFYDSVTAAMDRLQICDPESIRVRNRFVMGHYESILRQISMDPQRGLCEKLRAAAAVGRMESFRVCSENGIRWGNPLYIWLYRWKMPAGVVLFFLLQQMKQKILGRRTE